MKYSIHKICMLFLFSVILFSCNDAEYDKLGVHAFISESTKNESLKVVIGEDGANANITVCLSEAIGNDAKFKLVVDPSVLEEYNKKQSAGFISLPEGSYEINPEITIKAGEFSAEATKIHIKPFTPEMMGESYALPLRLVSADGTIPTTQKTAAFVVTTEAIFSYSLPMFTGTADLQVKMPETGETYEQYTVEVRFQISDTGDRDRAVFKNFTEKSDNTNFVLLRFEDPQNPQNGVEAHSWVQVVGRDRIYRNPSIAFEPNKWQHLALTCNGSSYKLYVNGAFAGSVDIPAGPTIFKNLAWFCYGDSPTNFWGNCKILLTEARLWSVCRTDAQIANNMTLVSAKSNGLEGYWRFNQKEDGTKGNIIFKDLTGKGHDITTNKVPTKWIDNIKSTDVATKW